jgi:hypothetical protein
MPYKVFTTGNVLTAADMNAITADPIEANVNTDEARTTATYGVLATAGPTVTNLAMVNGQTALVIVSWKGLASSDGTNGYMGYQVTGASGTIAPSDDDAAYCFIAKNGTSAGESASRPSVFQATATGNHTFTSQYKGDGVNSMHFIDRRIIVKKF